MGHEKMNLRGNGSTKINIGLTYKILKKIKNQM